MPGINGRTKLLNKNEENNRVRRETKRNLKNKYDREDKRTKRIKQQSNSLLPDTAALQREIIVEGLSQTEQDYEAKLLYTRGKKQDIFKDFFFQFLNREIIIKLFLIFFFRFIIRL